MVSSVNSHTTATRIGWHLWEIDLRFAIGLPPGVGFDRVSVTLSMLTPLCPNGNSYRRVYRLCDCGLFTQSLCSPAERRGVYRGTSPIRNAHPPRTTIGP